MIYHLTDDGPKPCRARKRACPIGGKHFESAANAQAGYEATLSGEFGLEGKPKEVDFDSLFARPKFDEDKYLEETKAFFARIDDSELEALRGYTSTRYGDLNTSLYEGKSRRKGIIEDVRALDSALAKAPVAPAELWRSLSGRQLPQDFNAKKHRVGEVIHFSGFTSTSETADALMHIPNDNSFYMDEVPSDQWKTDPKFTYRVIPTKEYTEGPARNVIFKIHTKNAAPVSSLRSVLAEQEWLLPRDSKFRILAVHKNVEIGGLEHIRGKGTRAQIYEIEEVS